MLLIILFCALMIGVFGRLLVFALRFTWGIIKTVGLLVLAPLFLVALVGFGLLWLAVPLLAIFGLITLITEPAL